MASSDFAEADRVTLRGVLQKDLQGHLAATQFFPNLDALLRCHADKISILSDDWVREQVDEKDAARSIAAALPHPLNPALFGIDDSFTDDDTADWYYPIRIISEPSVWLDWDYFYAWPTNSEGIELSIHYTVIVGAEAECALDSSQVRGQATVPTTRTLPVYSVGSAKVIGVLRNGALTITGAEDVYLDTQ